MNFAAEANSQPPFRESRQAPIADAVRTAPDLVDGVNAIRVHSPYD